MKKWIRILSIGIVWIFLTGCGNTLIEVSKDEEIFRRKQECASYLNHAEGIEQKNLEESAFYNDSEVNASYEILEIFYSPLENTCLYTLESQIWYYDEFGKYTLDYWLLIKDSLTKKTIWSSWMFDMSVMSKREEELQDKVVELKGDNS